MASRSLPLLATTVATFGLLAIGRLPAQALVGPTVDGSAHGAQVVMVLNHLGSTAGFCTAVVLSPTVVLTAAHCVPKGADIRVHTPEAGQKPEAGQSPVLLPVTAVSRHPDYHPDAIKTRERSIDLAMVRLANPLPERFSPATVATAGGAKVGARFTVAGFGVTREGEGTSSGQLREATLAARAPLSQVLLWADDPSGQGAGACTGDSGAPVFPEGRDVVAALAVWSAGEGGRQCGSLTQAVWLAPQRGWIDRILEAWSSRQSSR